MGKLFILSERLNSFSDNFLILNENQTGFRHGYSTIDNIFTLYSFFEVLKVKEIKLYCAFIDFEKAFDNVWRTGLWQKCIHNNINGNICDVIRNMYKNIKSNIIFNKNISEYFPCEMGVTQGENLSPFLFALFLNDVEDYLSRHDVLGLHTISDVLEDELNLLMRIFILLYAEDSALMAETPKDLQKQLYHFYQYCESWRLKVNVNKTKILCFTNGSKQFTIFL